MAITADQASDMRQIFQAVLDVTTQALNVKLTQAALEITAASGDSIYVYPLEITQKATVPNGTATGTVVIAAQSAIGIKSYELVTNTTADLTATTPLVTLEWSPHDTDNVWLASTLTATPATTAAAGTASGTTLTKMARRVRVKFTQAAYSAGSFDCYLVGRG